MKRARSSPSPPTLQSVDPIDLRALSDELDLSDLMRRTVISTIDEWAETPTPVSSPTTVLATPPPLALLDKNNTTEEKHETDVDAESPNSPVRLWSSIRRLWHAVFPERESDDPASDNPTEHHLHETTSVKSPDTIEAAKTSQPPPPPQQPTQTTPRKPRQVTDSFEEDLKDTDVNLDLPSDTELLHLCSRLTTPTQQSQRRRITGDPAVDRRLAHLESLRAQIRQRRDNEKDVDMIRQRRRQRLIAEQRRLSSSLRVQRMADVPRNVKLPVPTRRSRLARVKDARARGGVNSPTGIFEGATRFQA